MKTLSRGLEQLRASWRVGSRALTPGLEAYVGAHVLVHNDHDDYKAAQAHRIRSRVRASVIFDCSNYEAEH